MLHFCCRSVIILHDGLQESTAESSAESIAVIKDESNSEETIQCTPVSQKVLRGDIRSESNIFVRSFILTCGLILIAKE